MLKPCIVLIIILFLSIINVNVGNAFLSWELGVRSWELNSQLPTPNSQLSKETLMKMRLSVSRLNYLHREAMIMFYIDSLPIKEIALRLKITENNVKKVLFGARNKVREAIVKMDNSDKYVYRPQRLLVTYTGQINDNHDIVFIRKTLSKQNICIERMCVAYTNNEYLFKRP